MKIRFLHYFRKDIGDFKLVSKMKILIISNVFNLSLFFGLNVKKNRS